MLVSIWNSFVFAALLFCVSCVLPLIAVTGDTLDAFFAGDRDASSTIRKPITAPAIRPLTLN